MMNRERVAKTWLFRGLSDLLFAFHNDAIAFEDNARFSEIMGLEKILKATLLYHRANDYEHLPPAQARDAINRAAAVYGHDFGDMLKKLVIVGLSDIDKVKGGDFDGYEGAALVKALKDGYMETRYPVPKPVSDSFPIGRGLTQDPLCSSGMTKFTYALSNACIFHLSQAVDLADMHAQWHQQFSHLESFARFNNLFWEPRCRA